VVSRPNESQNAHKFVLIVEGFTARAYDGDKASL